MRDALCADLKNYLAKLITALREVGLALRLDQGLDRDKLNQALEGLTWLTEAFDKTAGRHQVPRPVYDTAPHLPALALALEGGDEVAAADVLEYEVVQALYDMYERL